MNVLFIALDDLRPELHCYGKEHIHSPHIDRLAREGLLFRRAYCQAAVCRASRVSLLTGLRPDRTEIWSNRSRHRHFRDHLPDIVTLPQHFKNHGYHTEAIGKIFHGAFQVRNHWNDQRSWSVPTWLPPPRYYFTERGIAVARAVYARRTKARGKAIDQWVDHFVLGLSHEAPDVEDNVLQDGQIADRGIAALRRLRETPFFLALGFLKPHLPFIAPRKYWDLYPPGSVPVAPNRYFPKGAPPIAGTNWGHPRAYADFPKRGAPSDKLVAELTRGYAACVTYVDAQIGRVLSELDRLGLRDSTIVILWGDHGLHLGENNIWGKGANFELTTRAPLIVRDPRCAPSGTTDALVEFVDIYPSLCELAGLPLPSHVEGTSFAPLLRNPDRPWKRAAFSQYRHGAYMGRSIRTDRYRLTQWRHVNAPHREGGLELYDHESDPRENVNLAHDPDHADIVRRLVRQLAEGWRAALPDSPSPIRDGQP